MKKSRRLTLAEQAYQEIENRIISGSLPGGHRLLALELASEMELSQTPVKNALAALQRDGLVDGEARHGSTVRRFTLTDVAEIYEARILLELHAVERIVADGRVTPEFLRAMNALCDALASSLETGTQEGLAAAIQNDREFHETLVAQLGNSLISTWHRTAIRQFQTARNYSFATYPKDSTIAGHRAIVAALAQKDPDKAVGVMRWHLEGARDEMLARAPDDQPIAD